MATLKEVLSALQKAEASGNTEDARILANLAQKIMDDPSPFNMMDWGEGTEEEPGFFENVASGFGAGAVGMGEMSALGAASLLEEDTELAAREKIQSIAKALRPEGGDEEAISYKLASGLGSIVGLAAPAVAASMAAPASLATAAGLGTSALLASSAGAGEASERARAAGATEEERSGATLRGAGIGLLDVAPLGRVAKALEIPGLTKLIDKAAPKTINNFVDRLQNMAVTGTTEGLQEATSELLQNLNERGYNPERELVDAGLLEEGLVGGGAGAILQGIVDTVTKGRKIGAPKPPQEEPTPEETTDEFVGPVEVVGPPREQTVSAEQEALDEIEAAQTEPSPIAELTAEQEEAKKQQWFPDMEPEQRIERINEELSLLETSPDYADFSDKERKQVATSLNKAAKESRAEIKQRKQTAKEDAVKAEESAFADAEYDLFGPVPTEMRTREEATVPRTLGEVQEGLEAAVYSPVRDTPEAPRVTDVENRQAARQQEQLRQVQEGEETAQMQLDLPDTIPTTYAERDFKTAVGEAKPSGKKYEQVREKLFALDLADPEERNVAEDLITDLQKGKNPPKWAQGVAQDLQRRLDENLDTDEVAAAKEELSRVQAINDPELTELFENEMQFKFGPKSWAGIKGGATRKGKAQAQALAAEARGEVTPEQPDMFAQQRRADDALFGTGKPPIQEEGGVTLDEIEAAISADKKQAKRDEYNARRRKQYADEKQKAADEAAARVERNEKRRAAYAEKKRAERKKATRTKMQEAKSGTVPKNQIPQRELRSDDKSRSKPSVAVADGAGRSKSKPTDKSKPSKSGGLGGTTGPTRRSDGGAKRKSAPLDDKPSLTREETIQKALSRAKTQRVERFNKESKAAKAKREEKTRVDKAFAEWFKVITPGARKLADSIVNTFPKSVETDPTTIKDKRTLLNLFRSPDVARAPKAEKAARNYFTKFQRPVDALHLAVFDLVNEVPKFKEVKGVTTAEEKTFYAGMSAEQAKLVLEWSNENLSKETNAWIAKHIEDQKTRRAELDNADYAEKFRLRDAALEKRRGQEVKEFERNMERSKALAESDAVMDELIAAFGAQDMLLEDAVVALNMELHPSVAAALQEGDLKRALANLASTNPNERVQNVAKKLLNVAGSTKIETVENLKSESGKSVAGLFDPKTNTIKLDTEKGLNAHSLLHEMTHAGVSEVLDIKSHPITKQLTKLFEQVKPLLDTAYGATNLQEFVAEAFSNPVFQSKLAGMYPDGSANNAFTRFFRTVANYVRRLLGMGTKPLDSALDQVDAMVEGLLAPAPQHRFATEMPLNGGVLSSRGLAGRLGAIHNSFDKGNFLADVSEFLGADKVAQVAKNIFLQLSPSQALGDIARSVGLGKIGLRLHKLMEEQRGGMAVSDSYVHGKVREVEHWVGKVGAEKASALNDVIYDPEYGATLYQVDPSLTRQQAEKKYKTKNGKHVYDENGNNLWEIWEKQRTAWNKLGPDGQKVFNDMRATYDTLYKKLVDVIHGRIDAAMKDNPNADPEAATRLKKEVYERMVEKGKLDVYFPLIRQGDYKLVVDFADASKSEFKDSRAVLMFETKAERRQAMQTLEQDNNVIKMEMSDGDIAPKDYSNAPPSSFVRRVLDQLKASGVEPDVQEEIMRMYIAMLPETAVAKSLQRRKGTAGFVPDALVAMKTKAFDIGRQTVRMEYASKLQHIEDEIDQFDPKSTSEGKNWLSQKLKVAAPQVQAVKEELKERAKFARAGAKNKGFEQYIKTGNQVAFIYTLGFNASSALVNLSQIPLFVFPMLGGKYGHTNTFKALGDARRLVFGAGGVAKTQDKTAKNIARFTPAYGIDEYFNIDLDGNVEIRKDLPKNIDVKEIESIAPLVKAAMNRGQLNRSFMLDALGIEEGGRALRGDKARRLLDATSGVSAAMFNQAERINRQVTLVAAYKLAYNKLKTEHPDWTNTKVESEAAKLALYETQQTNGGAVLETAPRIAQQGIGRTAMMYKTYGIQMYSTMMKSGFQLIDNMFAPKKGESDSEKAKRLELRRVARNQLIGVFGSSLALAGVYGVPLYGAVQLIADAFFLEDDEDDFNTMVRKYLGEGWYKGAINEITGLDVASRVGLSHLLIQSNRFNPRASVEEDIMFYIGGPALSTGKRFIRAGQDFAEGEVMRGIESALPAGVSNVLKVTGGTIAKDGGFYTRRGDPIYSDMSTWEMMAKGVGFSPTEYTFRQEVNQRDKRVERAVTEERSKIMKRVYIAMRNGDFEAYDQAMEDMFKFNERHPTAGIDGKSLRRSLKQHQKTSSEMYNGVTINPRVRSMIDESRLEYSKSLIQFD